MENMNMGISEHLKELSRKRGEASKAIDSLKDQLSNLEGQLPELDEQMKKLREILDLNTNTVNYLNNLLDPLNEFLKKYKEAGLKDYQVNTQVHQLEMIIDSVQSFLKNGYEVSSDLNNSTPTNSQENHEANNNNTILFTPQTDEPELSTVSFVDDIPSEEPIKSPALDSSLESLFLPKDKDLTTEISKENKQDAWFNPILFPNPKKEDNNKDKVLKVVGVEPTTALSSTSSLDHDLFSNDDDYTRTLGRAA